MHVDKPQISTIWRDFRIALQALTRHPQPAIENIDAEDIKRSALLYPVVGLALGMELVLILVLFSIFDSYISAIAILIAWVYLTDLVHYDGFIETLRQLVSSQRSEAIEKPLATQPSIELIIVSTVLVLLIAKISVLAENSEADSWHAIVVACILGRTSVLGLISLTPQIEPGSFVGLSEEQVDRNYLYAAIIVACLVCIVIGGWGAVFAVATCAVIVYFIHWFFTSRALGVSGNIADSLIIVTELTALLLVAG